MPLVRLLKSALKTRVVIDTDEDEDIERKLAPSPRKGNT